VNQLQLPLTATEARDQAIQQVHDHAPPDWFRDALDAVLHTCRCKDFFTTDDVTPFVPPPPEPRAWGAVMREAAKYGLCATTKVYQNSNSAVCHARPKRVWRSLLRSLTPEEP
jgi:hypothetical protein